MGQRAMRYENFINESTTTSVEEILYLLYYKCEPFLNELLYGGNTNLLYSGRKDTTDYFEKNIRKNRRSLDTPEELHKMMDDLLYNNFGVYGRSNSIFCTGDIKTAANYGHVYSIYPIGKKYTYIWNIDITDFYTDFFENGDYIHSDIDEYISDVLESDLYDLARDHAMDGYNQYISTLDPDKDELPDEYDWVYDHTDEYLDGAMEVMYDEIEERNSVILDDLINGYTDTKLTYAIRSMNEIMLSTKTVIGISSDYNDYLKMYFKKNDTRKPTSKLIEDTFKNVKGNRVKLFKNR